MKYAFIKAHREDFSITRMCHLMKVSTSAYYEWLSRPQSKRQQEDQRLAEQVVSIHQHSRETYGARRIRHELNEAGETISRARVRRLMKSEGLEAINHRKFKATTRSDHGRPVAPNLLDRRHQHLVRQQGGLRTGAQSRRLRPGR